MVCSPSFPFFRLPLIFTRPTSLVHSCRQQSSASPDDIGLVVTAGSPPPTGATLASTRLPTLTLGDLESLSPSLTASGMVLGPTPAPDAAPLVLADHPPPPMAPVLRDAAPQPAPLTQSLRLSSSSSSSSSALGPLPALPAAPRQPAVHDAPPPPLAANPAHPRWTVAQRRTRASLCTSALDTVLLPLGSSGREMAAAASTAAAAAPGTPSG